MPRSNHAGTQSAARRRARNATTAAVLGASALAALGPSPAAAAVNGTHVIAPLYRTSGIELSGYSPTTTLNVTASRNGVTLSTATATTDSAGATAINGGAADCWTGTTPEMLPGDTITVSGDGPVDSMVVQSITAGRPELVGGDIVVHGTAEDLSTHGQVPVANIDSRIISGKANSFDVNGKRELRAGTNGSLSYDAPGSTSWTATFSGLSAADQQRALGAIDSRGVETPIVSEVTISQNPAAPGPQAPCSAPLVSNGVTSTDHMFNGHPTVNQANAGSDVILGGVAQADATAVSVQIGDSAGGATTVVPATLTAGPTGGQAWTAPIPAAEVQGLADGTLTAAATITTPGGDIGGMVLPIAKDTVAPGDPGAAPGPGTYATSQQVLLTSPDGTATIHYTLDGSDPGQITPVASAQVAITSSLTLRAIAIDPSGNPSAIADLVYTITPPVVTPPAGGGGTPPAGGGTPPAGGGTPPAGGGTPPAGGGTPPAGGGTTAAGAGADITAASATTGTAAKPKLAVTRLGTTPRLRLRKAQKSGVRITMRVPAGTEIVKVNIYRRTSKGLRLLSSGLRAPAAAGLYRVTQSQAALRRLLTRGSYEVQVTPGYGKTDLGRTSKATFKVV